MGWWTWCTWIAVARGAEPFPTEAEWVAIEQAAVVPSEPLGDQVSVEDSVDLLGDAVEPVLAWDASETTVFFRQQVAAAADSEAWAWGWLADTDGNDLDFEVAIFVETLTHTLMVYDNVGSVDGLFVA